MIYTVAGCSAWAFGFGNVHSALWALRRVGVAVARPMISTQGEGVGVIFGNGMSTYAAIEVRVGDCVCFLFFL